MEGVKCTLPKCKICFGIGKLIKNLDVLRHTNQPIPKFGLVFSSGRNKEMGWPAFYVTSVGNLGMTFGLGWLIKNIFFFFSLSLFSFFFFLFLTK